MLFLDLMEAGEGHTNTRESLTNLRDVNGPFGGQASAYG
jgi:hypothetical protein